MDNISSLIHDLRERIAASASDAASSSNSHPVETEFRVVLPILLDAYVVPSSTGNERDFNAVLKLLSHTARNYPGVFFHGRAAALLPVIGRLLPFLAHPAFSSHHGDICETIVSLLSLLRTGEPEVYRQFVLDAMVVVRDVLHISSTLSLKCFSESFSFILNCSETFSELPVCCRPLDGPGVLIIIDNKKRWQPFAAWTIRLINNCLTGGTLHVEELIDDNFAYSVCSYLLCYGDATLHMACFEFARLTTTVIPLEKFIRSIASILCMEENKFRNIEYDSCMGACLHLLHSSCSDEIVKSTANEIMTAFPRSICSTESYELQAKDSSLLASVLLIYLQAVHSILCLQDGEELSSVLEFYHVQTGSDNRELFASALPALLDELLCFSGEGETDVTELRTFRIPVMVEEVAKILNSSDDLPSFLKNHFVGLLNSIDRKMLRSKDLWLQK